MDRPRSVDVWTLGVNLYCGVRTNGCQDRTKILDGGKLVCDISVTQCQVENDAWGHWLEMRRGQKWTQHKNAMGWEGNLRMPYAKAGYELEKESEGGKRRACSWWKEGE